MRPNHLFSLQTTASVLALAGAFWAGRNTVADTPPATVKNQAATGRTTAVRPARASREDLPAETSQGPTLASGRMTADPALPELPPEKAAARLKSVLDNPDPVARMADYLAYLGTLKTNESRQAALEALMDGFDFRQRGRELTLLMSVWAQADAPSALAAAQERKDQMGMHTAGLVLSQWARKEPDLAIAWAAENGKKMNEGQEGNWYMASVLGSIAKTDPDRAAALAQTAMNRSQARGQVLDQIVEQLVEQRGAQAGQAWAGGLPEGPFRNGALERLAGRLADQNSAEAATWATSLPDSEGKTRALTAVVEQWAEDSPREAGTWLNQLPVNASTDAPRERFVWKVAEQDPAAAVSWAATITDEKTRSDTTAGVLKNWFRREPDKAGEWLAASSLPDDLKQRFTPRKK